MERNGNIHIERVSNGFVVKPGWDGERLNPCWTSADVHVFRDLVTLGMWLVEHFPEVSHGAR